MNCMQPSAPTPPLPPSPQPLLNGGDVSLEVIAAGGRGGSERSGDTRPIKYISIIISRLHLGPPTFLFHADVRLLATLFEFDAVPQRYRRALHSVLPHLQVSIE